MSNVREDKHESPEYPDMSGMTREEKIAAINEAEKPAIESMTKTLELLAIVTEELFQGKGISEETEELIREEVRRLEMENTDDNK